MSERCCNRSLISEFVHPPIDLTRGDHLAEVVLTPLDSRDGADLSWSRKCFDAFSHQLALLMGRSVAPIVSSRFPASQPPRVLPTVTAIKTENIAAG